MKTINIKKDQCINVTTVLAFNLALQNHWHTYSTVFFTGLLPDSPKATSKPLKAQIKSLSFLQLLPTLLFLFSMLLQRSRASICFVLFYFIVWQAEHRALCMLGKCSITELHFHSSTGFRSPFWVHPTPASISSTGFRSPFLGAPHPCSTGDCTQGLCPKHPTPCRVF